MTNGTYPDFNGIPFSDDVFDLLIGINFMIFIHVNYTENLAIYPRYNRLCTWSSSLN